MLGHTRRRACAHIGHIVLVLVARCSDWRSHRELITVLHGTADLGDLGAQIVPELGDIVVLESIVLWVQVVPREDEVAIVSHDGLMEVVTSALAICAPIQATHLLPGPSRVEM